MSTCRGDVLVAGDWAAAALITHGEIPLPRIAYVEHRTLQRQKIRKQNMSLQSKQVPF
jgi:hypothetical protein